MLTWRALAGITLLIAAPAFAQSPKSPYESSAALDGADALVGNIGTLGFHDAGLSATYRFFGPPPGPQSHSWMGAFTPLSSLTLAGGVDFVRLDGRSGWVTPTGAAAFRVSSSLSVALAVRGWTGWGDLRTGSFATFDVGAAYRPFRWLSLAGSIDNATQPGTRGVTQPLTFARFYSMGLAVCPFQTEFMTLGIDVRLRDDVPIGDWPAPRATFELRPLSWLAINIAARTNGDFFFGLALRERNFEAGGGLSINGAKVNGTFATLRYRARPSEGVNLAGPTTVQLALTSDLRPDIPNWWLLRLGERPVFGEIPLELYRLADRADVSSVRVIMQNPRTGLATLRDIRDALAYLKKKGKKIYVELGDADDKDLFVASVADEVIAQPQGTITLNGMKVTLRFFKNILDKLGAKVEAFTSGPYKNSPDSYTRDEPRPEHIEAQQAIVDQFHSSLVTALGERSKLTPEVLTKAFDQTMFSGAEAQKIGLVDSLAWPVDPKAPPPDWRYDRITQAGDTKLSRREWAQGPAIGLVSINGVIMGGESFEDPFGLISLAGANTVVKSLRHAMYDDDIKAVVVRIDSPGGDILASDLIWQQMRQLKEIKPVIVSMGDTCASGGYYIAAPADLIYAQPETITGSIGVFSYRIDLSGLFDKIGITQTTVKSAPHADMFEMTRPLDDKEREIFQGYVMQLYGDFLDKVAAGRNMNREAVDKIAKGRVWSGKAARELGLVDKLGGLVDAIEEAKRRSGLLDDPAVGVRTYPNLQGPLRQFATEASAKVGGLGASLTPGDLTTFADTVRNLITAFEGRAMYMYPYAVSID